MSKSVYTDLDMQSSAHILNLPAPAGPNEPARKADLDAAISGISWKVSARTSATANINLTSPGSTVGGITMVAADRFLARGQTSGLENGIYIWNGAAIPATRAPDADSAAELESAVITVDEGPDAGATFRQTAVNFTLGTDPVAWTSFVASAGAASESSAGIIELATQAETNAGTDDARAITPLKFKTSTLRAKEVNGTVGDGSATSYDISHGFGTRNVHVAVWRNSGLYDEVIPDINHKDNNTVTLIFKTAPSSAQFAYEIIGF